MGLAVNRATFMRKARRSIHHFLVLALVVSTLSAISAISAPDASAAQGSECVIGSSESCPATSPQEIYNLYGTTTDGTYWVKVNGTATSRQVMML